MNSTIEAVVAQQLEDGYYNREWLDQNTEIVLLSPKNRIEQGLISAELLMFNGKVPRDTMGMRLVFKFEEKPNRPKPLVSADWCYPALLGPRGEGLQIRVQVYSKELEEQRPTLFEFRMFKNKSELFELLVGRSTLRADAMVSSTCNEQLEVDVLFLPYVYEPVKAPRLYLVSKEREPDVVHN